MPDAFYVTPSRISGALQCGLRYHRQYVQKLPGDKPGLAMFAGDMQHKALQRWGTDGSDLIESHRAGWFAEGPDGLVRSEQGKGQVQDCVMPGRIVRGEGGSLVLSNTDVEACPFDDDPDGSRHFSALGRFLHYGAQLARVELAEAELVERILTERPDLKKPRASKEFKEAADKLDPDAVRTRLEKVTAIADEWFRSGKSPWQVYGPGPLDAFTASEDALRTFAAWWASMGDNAPDIVYTETKARIPLGGDRFNITGVIDAVYLWLDGSVEVVDYKRSSGREDDISHFIQAATYNLTCREVIGIEPSRVVFHHLKEGSRLVYDVRDNWTERLIELAERVKRMHDTNDFAPSFRTCSWCEYRRLCHEHFEFNPVEQPARIEEAVAA